MSALDPRSLSSPLLPSGPSSLSASDLRPLAAPAGDLSKGPISPSWLTSWDSSRQRWILVAPVGTPAPLPATFAGDSGSSAGDLSSSGWLVSWDEARQRWLLVAPEGFKTPPISEVGPLPRAAPSHGHSSIVGFPSTKPSYASVLSKASTLPPSRVKPSPPRIAAKSTKPPPSFCGDACFRCLKAGHIARFCSSPVVCYHCRKPGHVERHCPLHKKEHPEKPPSTLPLKAPPQQLPAGRCISFLPPNLLTSSWPLAESFTSQSGLCHALILVHDISPPLLTEAFLSSVCSGFGSPMAFDTSGYCIISSPARIAVPSSCWLFCGSKRLEVQVALKEACYSSFLPHSCSIVDDAVAFWSANYTQKAVVIRSETSGVRSAPANFGALFQNSNAQPTVRYSEAKHVDTDWTLLHMSANSLCNAPLDPVVEFDAPWATRTCSVEPRLSSVAQTEPASPLKTPVRKVFSPVEVNLDTWRKKVNATPFGWLSLTSEDPSPAVTTEEDDNGEPSLSLSTIVCQPLQCSSPSTPFLSSPLMSSMLSLLL